MRTRLFSTAVQRNLALAVPLLIAAWFMTVPAVLTTTSFLALAGFLVAAGWVATMTYSNGQPAASLAQILYDTEETRSADRPRDAR